MANKPWISEEGGKRLEAFLGSRGMKTSEIETTADLILTASGVFEIPMETSCAKMADVIASMSKSARRALAKKNLGPTPSPSGRPKKALKGPIDALAANLGVSPSILHDALRGLVDRQQAISDSKTKTLSQRAAEATAIWRSSARSGR